MTKFFLKRGDKVRGPLSTQQIQKLRGEGKLRATDLISTRDDGGWRSAVRSRKPSSEDLFEDTDDSLPPPRRRSKKKAAHKTVPRSKTALVGGICAAGTIFLGGLTWFFWPNNSNVAPQTAQVELPVAIQYEDPNVDNATRDPEVDRPDHTKSSNRPDTTASAPDVSVVADNSATPADAIPKILAPKESLNLRFVNLPYATTRILRQSPELQQWLLVSGSEGELVRSLQDLCRELPRVRVQYPDACIVAGVLKNSVQVQGEAVIGRSRFVAISKTRQIRIRFCGDKLKPLVVSGICPNGAEAVVLPDQMLQDSESTDLVTVRFRPVDATGIPVSVRIKSQRHFVHVAFPSINELESDCPIYVPYSLGLSVSPATVDLKAAPHNGVVEIDVSPTLQRFNISSDPPSTSRVYFTCVLTAEHLLTNNVIDLGEVGFQPKKTARVTVLRSPVKDFSHCVPESRWVNLQPSSGYWLRQWIREQEVASFGLTPTTPLLQHRKGIAVPGLQFMKPLGTGDLLKSVAQTLPETPADDFSERDTLRSQPGLGIEELQSPELAALGTVYFAKTSSNEPEWLLFKIDQLETIETHNVQEGTKLFGPAFADVKDIADRCGRGLEIVSDRQGDSPRLELFLRGNDQVVSNDDLSAIARLKGRVKLSLYYDLKGYDSKGLEQLATMQGLESLSVALASALDDRLLEQIALSPNLRELIVWSNAISDRGLSCLAKAPKLETLFVNSNKVTDSGLERLAAAPQLESITIRSGKIDGGALLAFKGNHKLTSLAFNQCKGFDSEKLKYAATIPALKKLTLRDTDCDTEDVGALRAAKPSLELNVIKDEKMKFVFESNEHTAESAAAELEYQIPQLRLPAGYRLVTALQRLCIEHPALSDPYRKKAGIPFVIHQS